MYSLFQEFGGTSHLLLMPSTHPVWQVCPFPVDGPIVFRAEVRTSYGSFSNSTASVPYQSGDLDCVDAPSHSSGRLTNSLNIIRCNISSFWDCTRSPTYVTTNCTQERVMLANHTSSALISLWDFYSSNISLLDSSSQPGYVPQPLLEILAGAMETVATMSHSSEVCNSFQDLIVASAQKSPPSPETIQVWLSLHIYVLFCLLTCLVLIGRSCCG